MIEINLVPDVKQEFIRAQRNRTAVTSIAILASLIAGGIVALLAVYVFAVQGVRGLISDNTIKDESEKLQRVEDVNKVVTLQNQTSKLSAMHSAKTMDSRVFDVLGTVNPSQPNRITISNMTLNVADKTITIEAQAENGYEALETYKKTIQSTKLTFSRDGTRADIPLTESVSVSEQSTGEDISGKKVLRFTLSFTYPEELFSRSVSDLRIVGPERTNATDSFLGVPKSLFNVRASDEGGN